MPQDAPDRVVQIAALAATLADVELSMTREDPGLNPYLDREEGKDGSTPASLGEERIVLSTPPKLSYHPNHKRTVPNTTRIDEWPGMSTGLPISSKRPARGPTSTQPTRPATKCLSCGI
jgi:hypothetical protein